MPTFPLSYEVHSRLVLIFGAIGFSTIALPMLPVWQGAIRLLAGLVLIAIMPYRLGRRLLMGLLPLLALVSVVIWLQGLLQNPVSHVMHALTDIYGQPLGLLADGAILLFDTISVVGLGLIAIRAKYRQDRLLTGYVASLLLFWCWSLLGTIAAMFQPEDHSTLAQMMTGTSVWATWVYFALIAIILLRDESDVHDILGWIGVGGLVVAFVIAIQWAVGDYSYILDAPRFADYFNRVRGTYYYHTSATLALIICGLVMLALAANRKTSGYWILGASIFMITMIVLNNTRAMSIALLVGLFVVGLGAIRQKRYLIVVLAVAGGLLISSNILYVKPLSGSTLTIDTVDEPQLEESQTGDAIDKLTVSNKGRSLLLKNSLKLLGSTGWFGSGIGVLEIPLMGNSFGGIRSTYSSHTLYLDIILMAGIPPLFAFVTAFMLGAYRSTVNGFLTVGSSSSYRSPALLAVLTAFGVAFLFVPQERHDLIGIAFLLGAVAVLTPGQSSPSEFNIGNRLKKWIVALILVAVGGWSFLTSPTYVFPAIELIARHGSQIKAHNSSVVITEPAMKSLTELMLELRGVRDPDVRVLRDEMEDLPKANSWVLWSPGSDSNYPNLRKLLGYQAYRQDGHAPSIKLPPDWWIVSSAQPATIISYAGARAEISVPFEELAARLQGPETVLSGQVGKQSGAAFTEPRDQISWSFRLKPGVTEDIRVVVVSYPDRNEYETDTRLLYAKDNSVEGKVDFGAGVLVTGTEIGLSAYIATLPNIAIDTEISVLGNKVGADRSLADLNHGTGTYWPSESGNSILIKLASVPRFPIGIYRMVAINFRGGNYAEHYSWVVEASKDGEQWHLLDQREAIAISTNPNAPSSFFLSKRGLFQYYRIRFLPSLTKGNTYSGLMELELYPLPDQ